MGHTLSIARSVASEVHVVECPWPGLSYGMARRTVCLIQWLCLTLGAHQALMLENLAVNS
jgi:hypothetical protein